MKLMKNVKANWWDHIINLIVVFLGVTIAFQLGSWKENRDRKQLEREFCINMISDLDTDLDALRFAIDSIPNLVKSYNLILQSSYANSYDHPEMMTSIFALYNQMYVLTHHVTYKSFSSSGKLDIIKDLELKRNITLYYEIYAGFMQRMEKGAEDYRSTQFLPYIMKNVKYGGTVEGPKLADDTFLSDSYFINLLIGKIRIEEGKLYGYKQSYQHAEKLKENLEQYLKKL